MTDDELFARLADSAPPTAARCERLSSALDDAVTASRPPRRRPRRLLATALTLSVMVLGGTSAACATPPVLEWLGFAPDRTVQHSNADGAWCSAGMIVRPEGVSADDASFVAAQRILLDLDFDKIVIDDVDPDAAGIAAAAAAARAQYNASNPSAAIAPAAPDPETDRLLDAVYARLIDGVRAQGLDEGHSTSLSARP